MNEVRYVYNPYVLNLLYGKVLYLERLREFYGWWRAQGREGARMDEEARRRVVRDNVFDAALVGDVWHLMAGMRRERFHFDLYYANYEYVLFRLLCLLAPTECDFFRARAARGEVDELGDLFGADLKCLEFLEAQGRSAGEKSRRRLFLAVARYVAQHYFERRAGECEEEALKRSVLLLNLKQSAERGVAERQAKDGGGSAATATDYTIVYSKDVVTTMMYLFFVDACVAQLEEARADAALKHQYLFLVDTEAGDDSPAQRRRDLKSLGAQVELLGRLRVKLQQQYEDEFAGYSIVDVFPGKGGQRPRGSGGGGPPPTTHFERYTLTRNTMRRVNAMRDTTPEEAAESGLAFLLHSVDTRSLPYLSLRRNREHYEYVVRRFIFDHALRREHSQRCARRDGGGGGGGKTACAVCRYEAANAELCAFYDHAERYAYNTCHYVQRDSPRLANEATLHRFLASVLLELLPPLHALLYKNLWQTLVLFLDADLRVTVHEYCESPGRGRGGGVLSSHVGAQRRRRREVCHVNLFQMIDLGELMRHVVAHYESADGGADARIETVLHCCRQRLQHDRARGAAVVERWHTRLAIDLDLLCLMMRAVAAQQAEVEKFERSLASPHAYVVHDSDDSQRAVHRALNRVMVELYELYASELSLAMREK